jgi:hypothetical protein
MVVLKHENQELHRVIEKLTGDEANRRHAAVQLNK